MAKIYFQKLHSDLCNIVKPPSPSINSVPKWWKNANKHILNSNNLFPNRNNATIRSCPAINDAFNFGYTVFTPIDIFIDSTQSDEIFWDIPINIEYLDFENKITEPFVSFISGDAVDIYNRSNDYHRFIGKMNTFWGIKTDPGYSIWITTPIGRDDLPFKIFDTVIDSDNLAAIAPYSFLIKRGFKGIIKAGTPFIQVIPFKREDFVSEIVERDSDLEKRNFLKLNTTFINSYKKNFWNRKKFE